MISDSLNLEGVFHFKSANSLLSLSLDLLVCSSNDDSSLLVVFNDDSLDSDINDLLLCSNPVQSISSEGQDKSVFLVSDLLDDEKVSSVESSCVRSQSGSIVDRDSVELEFVSSDDSDSSDVDDSSGLVYESEDDSISPGNDDLGSLGNQV